MKLPGVADAVFFVPKHDLSVEVERLAAFVVAPNLNRAQIHAGLRAHVDPVFLPRPLIFVDAIPRDGNGKIRAAALQAMIAQHLTGDV
jgi:acyl-coenzyme A synthetase/AMP-(fatty) acid ligase